MGVEMLKALSACVLMIIAVVVITGCGDAGDAAAERVTVTQTVPSTSAISEATTEAEPDTASGQGVEDVPLLLDMASGLERISKVASSASACGVETTCITGRARQLSTIAKEELVGLESRVKAARRACVRDAGEWYVSALQRFELAYEFIESGDISGGTRNLVKASANLQSAGDTASACTP